MSASPSSDYLLALQLHLSENGAGFIDLSTLRETTEFNEDSSVDYVLDLTASQNLEASIQSSYRDNQFAKSLALVDTGVPHLPPQAVAGSSGSAWKGTLCQICMEFTHSSFRFVPGACAHAFCMGCMTQYLQEYAVRGNPLPVPCPVCREPLETQACLAVMAGTGSGWRRFELHVVLKIFVKKLRHCANKHCGVGFDWETSREGSSGRSMREDSMRISCPLCHTDTCAKCQEKWHIGQNCIEHELENVQMAANNKVWKQCPWCGHLIEKREGDCNFVKCICGCGFCFNCGKAYKSGKTASNSHGKPDCSCGLFQNSAPPPLRIRR